MNKKLVKQVWTWCKAYEICRQLRLMTAWIKFSKNPLAVLVPVLYGIKYFTRLNNHSSVVFLSHVSWTNGLILALCDTIPYQQNRRCYRNILTAENAIFAVLLKKKASITLTHLLKWACSLVLQQYNYNMVYRNTCEVVCPLEKSLSVGLSASAPTPGWIFLINPAGKLMALYNLSHKSNSWMLIQLYFNLHTLVIQYNVI